MYNWGIRGNEIIKFYFSQVQHNLVKPKLEPRAYVIPVITLDKVDIRPVDQQNQDSENPIEEETVTQPHRVLNSSKEKVTFISFNNIVPI